MWFSIYFSITFFENYSQLCNWMFCKFNNIIIEKLYNLFNFLFKTKYLGLSVSNPRPNYLYTYDLKENDSASRKVFARGCSPNSCVETKNVTCCYKDLCNITNNATKKFKNNFIFYFILFLLTLI